MARTEFSGDVRCKYTSTASGGRLPLLRLEHMRTYGNTPSIDDCVNKKNMALVIGVGFTCSDINRCQSVTREM